MDANGSTAGGVTTETFLYDGDELSMRFGNSGELTHRYVYGPRDQVLADETFKTVGTQRVSDEILWQLADQQGTVRDVADDEVELRKHIDYDSFGRVLDEVWYDLGGFETDWGDDQAVEQLFYYTGQERDAATGLQQHGARWYSPSMGRWMSEDPSGFDGGDPNLYRYVGNGPHNAVDPTGLIQAGNPLANLNLFAGGFTGGTVSAYKSPNQFVATGGGLSFYSTPKAVDQYFVNQGLQNLVNPSPLSGGLSSFVSPTAQQIAYAQANPNGAVTKVETIKSTVYGDRFRVGPDTASYNEKINRSYLEQAKRGAQTFAGNVIGGIVDAVLPPSDPSHIVHYADGTRTLYIGEGPSTGHLAGQAAIFSPSLIGSTSRPSGSITLQTGSRQESIAPFPTGVSQPTNLSTGSLFNRVRANKYEFQEVYVESSAGARFRVDSYSPATGEIISRKFTQLSEVTSRTAKSYISEAAKKYPPGSQVANVASSGSLTGQQLQGKVILEVPIQINPVPKAVLDAAAKRGVVIRDVNGRVYSQ